MSKKIDKTPAVSYRTDMLRKQAMVRIALFHEFRHMHPEINFDEDKDMTDDQEAAWIEFSKKALGESVLTRTVPTETVDE